ncbi:MAG: hypothetical protein V7K58_05290 [Nostoc sp.]
MWKIATSSSGVILSRQLCSSLFKVKKDSELGQLCNTSNPNRIYYLPQEVADTSITGLAKAVTMMLNLEMSINRGAESKDLLPTILSVSRLFNLT